MTPSNTRIRSKILQILFSGEKYGLNFTWKIIFSFIWVVSLSTGGRRYANPSSKVKMTWSVKLISTVCFMDENQIYFNVYVFSMFQFFVDESFWKKFSAWDHRRTKRHVKPINKGRSLFTIIFYFKKSFNSSKNSLYFCKPASFHTMVMYINIQLSIH